MHLTGLPAGLILAYCQAGSEKSKRKRGVEISREMARFADDVHDSVNETVVDNESAPTFSLSSFCLPYFQKMVRALSSLMPVWLSVRPYA